MGKCQMIILEKEMGNIGTGHGKFEIGKMEDKRHEELEFDIHSP